jgi:hypothetical protein
MAFRTICLDQVVSSVACKERRMQDRSIPDSDTGVSRFQNCLFLVSVPKLFVFYRLNSFCLWDCVRAGPAEFRHLFKAFLFSRTVLCLRTRALKENLLTETENSKSKIQNTNPDRMQQQSGMFSSVFILNALFDLSDDLSTFRSSLARPVCELYTVFKAKQVSGVQLLYFRFKRNVLFAHSLP